MPENENKIAGSCWGGISIAAANNLRQNDIKSSQNNKPIKCILEFWENSRKQIYVATSLNFFTVLCKIEANKIRSYKSVLSHVSCI